MNNTYILYDEIQPEEDFIRQTRDGKPVWPVQNADELAALERIAQVFNSRIEKVDSQPTQFNSNHEELVAALGKQSLETAYLYAHLTSRNVCLVENLTDLASLSSKLAVVVTTAKWLDDPLLSVLYDSYEGPAVGIICAQTLPLLRRQVLFRAAAANLAGPVSLPRLDIWPLASFDKVVEPGYELVGRAAGDAAIKEALGRGAGVLTLITHSDGVDTLITSQLTLCSMNTPPSDADKRHAPRCQITGYCHRQNMPVQDALTMGRILTPEELAARIFVYDVCYGVLLQRGAIDNRWGIIWRLLDNPALGSIITNWEIIITGLTEINGLASTIADGENVGHALGSYIRSRTLLRRACLFGDPRVQLPMHSKQLPLIEAPITPPIQDIQREQDLRALDFLQACILTAMPAFNGDLANRANSALSAIQDYMKSAWLGQPLEGEDSSPGAHLRSAILYYLFRRGKLVDDWQALAVQTQCLQSRICWHCNTPANSRIVTLRIPNVPQRRMSICPRCGFIEDVPTDIDLHIQTRGNTIYLKGNIPQEKYWIGGVTLWSGYTDESVSYYWPETDNGLPAPYFTIPSPYPTGPLRTAVTFLWRTTIVLLSGQIHSEQLHTNDEA